MRTRRQDRPAAHRFAAIITCRTASGGEVRTAAFVYGNWAVHRSLDPQAKHWAITQVHSGYGVPSDHAGLLTKKQAIEIAKLFDEAQGTRRVTRGCGGVLVQMIYRLLARDTKRTLGEQQHDADVAEGCP